MRLTAKESARRDIRSETGLHVAKAAENDMWSDVESTSPRERNTSAAQEGVPLLGETCVPSDVSESKLIKVPDRHFREGPPWWVKRWTELLLFSNSTERRVTFGSAPADAIRDTLSADVVAAEFLQRFVAANGYGGPRYVLTDVTERDGPLHGGSEDGCLREMMVQSPPPWHRKGESEKMTFYLVRRLQEQVQKFCEAMESGRPVLQERHAVHGGSTSFDGLAVSSFCPAVRRLCASVLVKSILSDITFSSNGLRGGRAEKIADALLTHVPLIHSEYITDERVQPVYDPSALRYLDKRRVTASCAEVDPQTHRSLIIYIDYIRFRPPMCSGFDGVPRSETAPRDASSLCGMEVCRSASFSPKDGKPADCHENFECSWLSFDRHDELVSEILDCYEPYRIIEMNLIPHIKSRSFYRSHLEKLRRQRDLTEEQKALACKLEELQELAADLEHSHLARMVSAWGDLLNLRRRNFKSVQGSLNSGIPQRGMHEYLSLLASLFQASNSRAIDGLSSSCSFPGNEGGNTSILTSPRSAPEVRPIHSFHFGLMRGNARVDPQSVGNENLLQCLPVVEGLTTLSWSHNTQFKVILFARTSASSHLNFVGATEPRALTASKLLFVNESFEFHAAGDLEEILMHVVVVGGAGDNKVVATVGVVPSRTRACFLLPLRSPVSFTCEKMYYNRYDGFLPSGTVFLSTDWAAASGMTMYEIEELFLSGECDPLNPECQPLLDVLKNHYRSLKWQANTQVNVMCGPGYRGTDGGAYSSECGRNATPTVDSANHAKQEDVRLQLLRRRWMIYTKCVKPRDEAEVFLLSRPIPVDCVGQCESITRLAQDMGFSEDHRKSSEEPLLKVLDDASPLILSLSPLPREEKLKLWQSRLRFRKDNTLSSQGLEDHEIQERLVIVPKLASSKPIHWTPENQLNPRRERPPKISENDHTLSEAHQDSHIVVHIMKATALPGRTDGTLLEPFVEVSFAYETLYSRCTKGISPSWFETLNIPFTPPDFDEDTLSLINDHIVVSLYDRVEIPMLPTVVTTGAVSHETHYRTERRLLGTLSIPFYSLYRAQRTTMEGHFVLTTPRWLLGYCDGGRELMNACAGEVRSRACSSPRPLASIQLYLALWPRFARGSRTTVSSPVVTGFVGRRDISLQLQYLNEIAIKWSSAAQGKIGKLLSVNPAVNQRSIIPFVLRTTRDPILVCRYLLAGGVTPPPSVVTVKQAIRFVSLLPLRLDMPPGRSGLIWKTNTELLRATECKYEELSLLLAHFLRFLAPNEVTYLVCGQARVQQRVTMVLHSFDGELHLVDPYTGNISPVYDPNLAFFSDVHTIISHDQVWANIQISGASHKMDWNLYDPRLWFPCFDHADEKIRFCMPFMAPIQQEALRFEPQNAEREQQLEQQLYDAVHGALMRWRNDRRPALHQGISKVLRKLLEEAEKERCAYASVRQGAVSELAAKLLGEYLGKDILQGLECHHHDSFERHSVGSHSASPRRVVGSPVNGAYMPADTGYRLMLRRVFETAVHETAADNVSFAIAVYVKGYTGNVFSAWVFLAALY